MAATVFPRSFVPKDLKITSFAVIEPCYTNLVNRPILSSEQLHKWLLDFSELTSVVDEFSARLYIAKTCDTEDKEIERQYLDFVENVEPKIKPLFFALQKKYLDSPYRSGLTAGKYAILEKKWRADVEMFRDVNIPLEVELSKLSVEFDRICGAMNVTIGGAEYTLPQASRFLEETDRSVREEAWRAIASRRLVDRARLDDVYDKMLVIRQKIADNTGVASYREVIWKGYKRFDYGLRECEAFHSAVERKVVPLIRALDHKRAEAMKVGGGGRLRPWDTEVDVKGRPPLRPFGQEDIDGFVQKTWQVFNRISPQLAGDFDSLRLNRNLDLASRKGKAPGGYQSTLDEVRQPFIFMNAAGMQGDVETLLHEGGHAFHALAAAQEELVFLRSAPIEFCEVASMAMELLGCEHFDIYYDNASEASRAKVQQLEGNIRILAWVATIDAFQHWIYTHPNHNAAERSRAWLETRARFAGDIDFSGLEAEHEAMWQRQLHIFQIPFYYIEYGIAQLGALQLWLKSQQDRDAALSNYRHALHLGGTRPLPDLFAAAGLHFDFSDRTVGPLVEAVSEELARLPD